MIVLKKTYEKTQLELYATREILSEYRYEVIQLNRALTLANLEILLLKRKIALEKL